MLKLLIECDELFDENTNSFINAPDTFELNLEHSLLAMSKWESKWQKPLLDNKSKTNEEIMDYIKCMTINEDVPDYVYLFLNDSHILSINRYIESPMTATTFSNQKHESNREIITSELIYYWMLTYNIPFECEKWHLNRLLTLIKVCNIKNSPPKKMSKGEILRRNKALNEARKRQLQTNG